MGVKRRSRGAERGECDFLVEIAAELPLQAIARLLGVPHEDRHRLFQTGVRHMPVRFRE